jgi:hypothetical protein
MSIIECTNFSLTFSLITDEAYTNYGALLLLTPTLIDAPKSGLSILLRVI